MAAAYPIIDESHNEEIKFQDQMGSAIPVEINKKILAKTGPAVCRIVTKEGVQGTGAIYNAGAGTEQTTLFATVKHVLSEASARSGTTELHFTEVEALTNVTLKKEWIAFFWENEDLDATVIELTASAIAELKAKSAKSLTINSNQLKLNVSGQPLEADTDDEPLKLAIAQYTTYKNKTEFSFAYNIAKSIAGDFIIYRIETTGGSSGSPVLNWDGEAIALHKGAWTYEKEIPSELIGDISYKRKGVMWQSVLPVFLSARTNFMLRHWLESIEWQLSASEKAIYYKKNETLLSQIISRLQHWPKQRKGESVGAAAATDSQQQLCATHSFDLQTFKSPDEEFDIQCTDLIEGPNGSILIADFRNRNIKCFSPVDSSARVAYRCPPNMRPHKISLKQRPTGNDTLLIVERPKEPIPVRYSVVAAEWNGNAVVESSRFDMRALPLTQSDETGVPLVTAHSTRSGWLLVGIQWADALEVVDSSGDAIRQREPLPLGFQQFCFAIGRVDTLELLAFQMNNRPNIRLMALREFAERLELLQLLKEFECDAVRLELFAGQLLCALWNQKTETHVVESFQVQSDGKSVRSVGRVLHENRDMCINCWRAVGQKLLAFDSKHMRLEAFDLFLIGQKYAFQEYTSRSTVSCSLRIKSFIESCNRVISKDKKKRVELKVIRKFKSQSLKTISEEDFSCYSFCRSPETDSVYFADPLNHSIKQLSLTNNSLSVVYSCDSNVWLRGVFHMQHSTTGTLLVAEMEPNEQQNTMQYFLAVTHFSANKWQLTHRYPIESASMELDFGLDFSFGLLPNGTLLYNASRTAQLEALQLNADGSVRQLPPLRLAFKQLCFTTGVCSGTSLLFINELVFSSVRILSVSCDDSLGVQLLSQIQTRCQRILWWNDWLLSAEGTPEKNSMEVVVWRVSAAGRRTERFATNLTYKRGIDINCWCEVGRNIVAFDLNKKELLVLSLKL